MKRILAAIAAAAALILALTGCSPAPVIDISQDEGLEMVARGDGILVDVRTQKEYDEGHIPGALLLPIEEIKEGKTTGLDDRGKTIILYCRTGRRAEDAAVLLRDMGFADVKNMGGIVEYKGEVEITEKEEE